MYETKRDSRTISRKKKRGLALLFQGKKPKKVAEILEVTRRFVDRWRQETKKSKKKMVYRDAQAS